MGWPYRKKLKLSLLRPTLRRLASGEVDGDFFSSCGAVCTGLSGGSPRSDEFCRRHYVMRARSIKTLANGEASLLEAASSEASLAAWL